MSSIEFRMRWREELEAIAYGRKLVFEMTIAGFQVYFPSEQRWREVAPSGAAALAGIPRCLHGLVSHAAHPADAGR
ncbi:MAG: hypothetical protein U1F11_10625 [Steroidobacteraceae bacterium]